MCIPALLLYGRPRGSPWWLFLCWASLFVLELPPETLSKGCWVAIFLTGLPEARAPLTAPGAFLHLWFFRPCSVQPSARHSEWPVSPSAVTRAGPTVDQSG